MTRQRRVILEVLRGTDRHPTADWIYEEVRNEIPNISLGTVYRNLRILSEMGAILELNYGSTHSRYDGNADLHYHFTCEECGRCFDVPIDIREQLEREVEARTGFQVNSHRLEFYGLCKECQNQEANGNGETVD
jgi:Fe2+ or Zn2+ uptake regulation protein